MAKITTTLYGALAIIPYQAEAPVKDTWEFLTDVIPSYNGNEQQIPLRNSPRRMVSYSIPLQSVDDPTVFNTVYGGIRVKWAVPMWAEGQFIGTVGAGLTTITCDTVYHDLRASSLAMLWVSPSNYRILEISSITATRISFPGGTTAMSNAFLIPVRIGYVLGAVSRPTDGFNTSFRINYQLDDLWTVTPTAPTQYLSNDFYTDVPLLHDGQLTTAFQRDQDIVDFELGKMAYRSPWVNTKYSSVFSAICATDVEVKNYRDFIFRRVGKYRKFWMPTFENNMRLKNTGTIVSTLVVFRDSWEDYGTQRTHIAIEANGVWYPRVISAPSYTDSTTVQFTLSSALNIPADTVRRICFNGLYRLDSDAVDFHWIGNNVLDSNVRVLELTP
jgi:hypothetical protein